MISNAEAVVFILVLLLIVIFIFWNFFNPRRNSLLSRLYVTLVLDYSIWALAMLGMWVTPLDNLPMLKLLDSITYLGIGVPAFYLMICHTFVRGLERRPGWYPLMLIMPVVAFFVSLTNDWHHLQYRVFSVFRSEIVFGPFVIVTGLHSYLCFLIGFGLLIRFALKNPSRLYVMQCSLLVLGGVAPLVVSIIATFSGLDLPITATPLSFLPLVICNGLAIYRFNLLDITPVATQHILDWISDCYLILSSKVLVISYNKPFASIFASRYGITENRYLSDCVKEEDISKKTAIYNIITAVGACRDAESTISYEQSVTVRQKDTVQKKYYVTDVSHLVMNDRPVGFVVIFKDITQLKKSMQQLQDSQTRMMEQERFAFLGQMIGGLAHNLKTPIMSVSGCVSAVDSLVDECLSSMDDPSVTREDYQEICGEMRDWLQKIRESTAYMSDIITAIKGQATSVSTFDESVFTLEELIKRTTLLMRHELLSAGCTLVSECGGVSNIPFHGDINNLVQVLGNLVSNAIYAQKQVGGGCITVGAEQEDGTVKIYVKDTGPGIPDSVRQRLFREMITSKGTQGSGLGLYISNVVVQAKFKGTMWCEDNPGGGAIFGLTIPLAAKNTEPEPAGSPVMQAR